MKLVSQASSDRQDGPTREAAMDQSLAAVLLRLACRKHQQKREVRVLLTKSNLLTKSR